MQLTRRNAVIHLKRLTDVPSRHSFIAKLEQFYFSKGAISSLTDDSSDGSALIL